MDNNSQNSHLFVTPDTEKLLHPYTQQGLTEALPPDSQVVLIGPDDFYDTGDATPSLNGYIDGILDPHSLIAPEMRDIFNATAGTGAAVAGFRVNDIILDMKQDEWPGKNFGPVEVMDENSCIVTIPMEGGAAPSDYHRDYTLTTPQSFAEAILVVKPGQFEGADLPGNAQDVQLHVGHHELDHCRNSGHRHGEIQSDNFANQRFAEDLKAGRATDAEFPYFVRDMRASAAILGTSGDKYLTNGLSVMAGETPLTDEQLDVAKEQVLEAQKRIYTIIEQDTGIRHETLLDPNNARMNARMGYDYARHMMEYGAFDDIPYGKTTVERFINGAESYAQDYFAVKPENYRNDSPVFSQGHQGHAFPNFTPQTNSGLDWKTF